MKKEWKEEIYGRERSIKLKNTHIYVKGDKMKNKLILGAKLFLPLLLGGIVGFIIAPFMQYNELPLPKLAPPAYLFPIVWTILYFLMRVSYNLLEWNNQVDEQVRKAYYLQLIINLIWPILFFIFQWVGFSAIWLVLLFASVIYMIQIFYPKQKLSAILQIPYLIWLFFALYLNIAIWLLK